MAFSTNMGTTSYEEGEERLLQQLGLDTPAGAAPARPSSPWSNPDEERRTQKFNAIGTIIIQFRAAMRRLNKETRIDNSVYTYQRATFVSASPYSNRSETRRYIKHFAIFTAIPKPLELQDKTADLAADEFHATNQKLLKRLEEIKWVLAVSQLSDAPLPISAHLEVINAALTQSKSLVAGRIAQLGKLNICHQSFLSLSCLLGKIESFIKTLTE